MNSLFSSRHSSIRQTGQNRASQKAIYRFLGNERVTEEELTGSCCQRTGELSEGRHLLVINDTTEINLQSHAGRLMPQSGVGLTGNNKDLGFFAHLGLAIDLATSQAIGYSSMRLWHRDDDKGTKESRGYRALPIEEKESYKWIQCANDSKKILSGAASITLVGDRESDIYELFTDAGMQGVDLVVRNRMNRRTTEGKLLYELLQNTPVCGNYTINLSGDVRKQVKKQKANLSVRYREVVLKKPVTKSDTRPQEVRLWVVEAREADKAAGICWRILTTHPVSNFEEALQIVEWYRMRWYIEEVFRLLKSKGYRIEDSQIESGWAIRKLTVMILHNILRVMQMLMAYSSSEHTDAGLTFSGDEIKCLQLACLKREGKTDKLKNKHPPGTLKWATWIIARLGGWPGYESQRPPGPITLKNGLDKFNYLYEGWLLAKEFHYKDVGTQ